MGSWLIIDARNFLRVFNNSLGFRDFLRCLVNFCRFSMDYLSYRGSFGRLIAVVFGVLSNACKLRWISADLGIFFSERHSLHVVA